MVSDLVTPSVEQCCVTKFIMKENMEPVDIFSVSIMGIRSCYVQVSVIDSNKFFEACKKVLNLSHTYVQKSPVLIC
jgi:hypothetical protein